MKIKVQETKIKVQDIGIAFMLIPFFIPNIVGSMSVLRGIYLICSLWKLAAMILGMVYIVCTVVNRNMNLHIIWWLIAVYYAEIFVSTLYNRGDVIQALETMTQVCILCGVIEILHRNGCRREMIKLLYGLYSIYMVLDLVFLILGIGEAGSGIFGTKNNHIYWTLPYLLLAVMYEQDKEGKVGRLFRRSLFLVMVITFITRSTTSILSVTAVAAFVVWSEKIKIKNRMDGRKILFAAVAGSFLLVTFQLQKILNIIVGVFQKTATFGRDIIWRTAWHYIAESPILGLGYETRELLAEKIRYTHMHNKWLDVLYVGGGIGLLVFIAILTVLAVKMSAYRRRQEIRLLSAGLAGYFILFLTEGSRYEYAFFVMAVMIFNHIKDLEKVEIHDKEIYSEIPADTVRG